MAILGGAFVSMHSLAQTSPTSPVNPLVPSANAMSLGLYGEVPVSLFNGSAQIDVPIYEIKGRSINLPISISYQTAAVRPDIHPSWVGMGWNLNVGGAITRTVNQLPDEFYDSQSPLGGRYYASRPNSTLSASDWSSDAKIKDDYSVSEGGKDTSPDIFNFNFLGISGKFFLDHTGQWKVQSERAINATRSAFRVNGVTYYKCQL